jgi:hypothetical protein
MRRRLIIGIAIVATLGAAVAYYLYENPCSDLLPCHDSANVVALEEWEVLHRSNDMFSKVESQARIYRSLELLPKPLEAHVSGFNAAITTDGPISAGSLEYAAVWYDVYHKYVLRCGICGCRVNDIVRARDSLEERTARPEFGDRFFQPNPLAVVLFESQRHKSHGHGVSPSW